MALPEAVRGLMAAFEARRDEVFAATYKETEVRQQFVDLFFKELGWDVTNRNSIRLEANVKVDDGGRKRVKHPDYAFRVGGETRFFLETKKPSVNLKDDSDPAFQVRRYGWSAKLPVSVLTDFQEFAVYDCRVEPKQSDKAHIGRLFYCTYEEYPDKWDEIAARLSYDAVAKENSLWDWVQENKIRGEQTVDAVFLRELEGWRERLAKDIALHNDHLTQRQLNQIVQATLDRIVFLRIAEDRGVEGYGRLAGFKGSNVYENLMQLFRQADERYNSGLFHFPRSDGKDPHNRDEKPDDLSPNITVSDDVLQDIINRLYYPASPYAFEVFPADMLGQIYERFLGKVITLTDTGAASVEEKPEVRKAGGVYYTPTYIVNYIVENTVGKLVEGKTPDEVAALRILDPACGSGSFLLGAYQYLLDWHLDYYVNKGTKKLLKERTRTDDAGTPHLTVNEKKRILTNNLYGVDLDQQAVEVTKLSLLLKVLEGETSATTTEQLAMFHQPVLPDLSDNVKWGNSLIGSDFYAGKQMSLFDDEEFYRVKAFDWEHADKGFGKIMKAGGFDAVIGNPPWLMAGYYAKETLKSMRNIYTSAKGKFDLYYLFVEKATSLVKNNGKVGLIIPNKFFHTRAASNLRQLLYEGKWVDRIVDFGDEQIFADATNYSCMVFLSDNKVQEPLYSQFDKFLNPIREFNVIWETFGNKIWNFEPKIVVELFNKLERIGTPLENLVLRFGTGLQSGADRILTVDIEDQKFEPEVLTPMLRGRDVRRYGMSEASKKVIFPYSRAKDKFQIMSEDAIQNYTEVFSWLEENKEKLSKRVWFGKNAEELSGKWYGIMYLDDRQFFEKPHLLTPSLSNQSNFTLGTGDVFATGTAGVTSIVPLEDLEIDIKYLLGVLNSKVISYYATSHSPVFSGGYYKFSSPYLKQLPIRTIDFDNPDEKAMHDEMVSLVEGMLGLHRQLAETEAGSAAREVVQSQIDMTDGKIDALVYRLYGLSEAEIAIVEG